MVSRIAAGALILLTGAALLPAQTTRPSQPPYTGVVVGKDVYVRCGPGPAYYPCAKLSYPIRVRMVAEQRGWAKIRPPRACFSLISKDYVRVEGVTGTVTGTNVRVRAGSGVQPGRTDQIQTHLNVGDEVTILGEQGDYHKIVPPAGVHLWVALKYVKLAGSEVLTTLPTQPAAVPPTTTRTVVVGPGGADALTNEKAEFDAAEAALVKEFQKPPEQRNLQAVLDRYKAIQLGPDSPLKPYVQARIKFLQGRIEVAENMLAADRLVRQADVARSDLAAQRAKIRIEIPPVVPGKTFVVEGELWASGIFRGGATGPKRYVIGDAQRSLIYAYLQCTTGVVDLAENVGAYVGISGVPQYDERTGMYVVEVERVIVLRAGDEARADAPTGAGDEAGSDDPAGAGDEARADDQAGARDEARAHDSTGADDQGRAPAQTAAAPKPPPVTQPAPVATKPVPPAPPEPVSPPPPPKPAPEPEKPLPPTGLPVAEPTTRPSAPSGVDPNEYE